LTEHPNAALVRRGFEAFNSGDVETLSGMFADDAVQVMGGNNLLTGEHKGREAILSMYGRLGEHTGGTFHAALERVFANDSITVALYHGTGQREGKALDQRFALLFEIANGRFVKITDLPEDPDAEDEFLA